MGPFIFCLDIKNKLDLFSHWFRSIAYEGLFFSRYKVFKSLYTEKFEEKYFLFMENMLNFFLFMAYRPAPFIPI